MKHDPSSFGKVGVLFGGSSAEREVSLMSGDGVLKALRARGVDAHPFDPGRQSLGELADQKFDRVFIALHGRYGEDGTIQGALEMLRIPYTGSGVLASAISMDKIATKRIWVTHLLPTPEFRVVDESTDWDRLFTELGDKVIVKPAHEGSTIGISKIIGRNVQALREAYEAASQFDSQVLVEEIIEGKELTCAILGSGDGARALPVVEIRAPQGDFTYEQKYFLEETQYICPAPLDEKQMARIQSLCIEAYNALGCEGWGRADVMLRARDDAPFLLEINSAPGMTSHSLVPCAAAAAGMSYEDLCMEMLASAAVKIEAK